MVAHLLVAVLVLGLNTMDTVSAIFWARETSSFYLRPRPRGGGPRPRGPLPGAAL